jgi:ferritin-like metal-binding protein YciE
MAQETETSSDVFHETLKEVYFAEMKIRTTFVKIIKALQDAPLKTEFERHLSETEVQIKRLKQIFAIVKKRPQGATCATTIEKADTALDVIRRYRGSPIFNIALVAAAQAIERYEISRYGILIELAEEMGADDAAPLLMETLEEEVAAEQALADFAISFSNQKARRRK